MANKLRNAIKAVNKTAMLCGSAAALTMLGMAANVNAQDDGMVEEVVVTGIRGALKQGLDTKRVANAVVDSIASEDIGKFPDKNIAESLQRIPGIQVQKGLTGEGQQVSIRGTDPQLTLTQLNGQSVASTEWFILSAAQRGFNFDMMPSEMVSGIDVYKSSMARLDEGGIGGTVIMKTRRPLDLDSLTLFGSVEYREADLSSQNGMAYSGMASWKNDAETFGVLLALATSEEVSARTTGENYWGWGAGNAFFDQDRERESADLTLQFAPTDSLNMVLHAFTSELTADNTNHNLLVIPADGGRGTIVGAPGVRNSANGSPLAGTITGNGADNLVALDSNSREATMTTDVIDFDVTYEGDGYTLHGQIGTTESEGGTQLEYGETWAVPSVGSGTIDFDFSGDSVGFDVNNFNARDGGLYVSSDPRIGRTPRMQEETYFQIDFKKDVELGVISSIESGFKMRDSEFSKTQYNSRFRAVDPVTGLTVSAGCVADSDCPKTNIFAYQDISIADFNGGLTPQLNPEGGSSTANRFAIPNMRAYSKLMLQEATFAEVRSGYGKVQEDIAALYTQANFEGDGFSGNVGVRYVETDASNEGYDPSYTNIVKGKHSYDNWLPSANLKIDLADDLVLRTSASKVMSRASYADLDPSFGAPNPTLNTATQGNITINPFLANQYDLGLEWYFADASLMSATVFRKDIESFIISEAESVPVAYGDDPLENWLVTRPTNGRGGVINGIELQYQQDFGNGFGTLINYTYADGEGKDAVGEKVDLPGNSENSYNITGYYENDLFSVRMAYTWRSEYLARGLSVGNRSYVDDTAQLDAAFVYHATEYLDITLEGVNLTNEVIYEYQPNNDISVHSETGARYFLGAKVRF